MKLKRFADSQQPQEIMSSGSAYVPFCKIESDGPGRERIAQLLVAWQEHFGHKATQLDRSHVIAYAYKRLYAYMTKQPVSEPETTRLTISWSKETDHALRTFLGAQGIKKGDISRFIEEAVRWRIFHQTVREAREAFADVSADELQKMIDEAVEDVRTKHYRERAQRS